MSQDKGKRIVINNVKKSMAPITNAGMQSIIENNAQKSPSKMANSFGLESGIYHKQKQFKQQIHKLIEENKAYKVKCDKSLIKVRFLTEKLDSYGGLHTLPENISKEVSETDRKIKDLEGMLYFKKSKQMKKLKRKIRKFLEALEFEVSDEDMVNIEDQVQIILFLIDVFSQKYNEIMVQKTQIDKLVQSLRQDTVFNRKVIQEEAALYKLQNQRLNKYLRQIELQLIQTQRHNTTNNQLNYPNTYNNSEEAIYKSNDKMTDNYQQNIKKIEKQAQNLKIEIQKLKDQKQSLQFELAILKRKDQESLIIISSLKNKANSLKEAVQHAEEQQNKWRQRYKTMEKQKDQRIRYLQNQNQKAKPLKNYGHGDKIGSITTEEKNNYHDFN